MVVSWKGCKVLVTGGASFIGSHLTEALVARGAIVTVVDDLSSGLRENIDASISGGNVVFRQEDLLDPEVAARAVGGNEVVFHLAARHGGRGFITEHDPECSRNLALDSGVFHACHLNGVDKVVYASSGCVYPTLLQTDPSEELFLSEDMVGPPFEADNLYGWAKLMAEISLAAYHRKFGMKSASCRYFTVYGPRGGESHAVMALIGRALRCESPMEVWGTGEQIRNWTHVDDIVEGTILAAEKIDDAKAVNLGTMERIRVIDAAREILRYTGHEAEIQTLQDKPTGPLNRAADNHLAAELLGWSPKISFMDGLHSTIDWLREYAAACVSKGL